MDHYDSIKESLKLFSEDDLLCKPGKQLLQLLLRIVIYFFKVTSIPNISAKLQFKSIHAIFAPSNTRNML